MATKAATTPAVPTAPAAQKRAAPTGVPTLTTVKHEFNVGRVAQPNPWIGVLREMPADASKEGWSVTQAFICPTEDVAGYARKIRAAGSALNKGVALQSEDNAGDKVLKTSDGFELAPGHSLVRFALRAVRKTKPRQATENTTK